MLTPFIARRGREGFVKLKPYWKLAAAVGLLSPLSYILVLQALSLGAPLSMVAPAREMSMMAGTLLGMIVLREKANIWSLLGCVDDQRGYCPDIRPGCLTALLKYCGAVPSVYRVCSGARQLTHFFAFSP